MGQSGTSSFRPVDIANRNTPFQDSCDLYLTRLPDPVWKTSSRCAGNGSCVEVAQISAGRIAVRDGMNPQSGKIIVFNPEEWRSFLAGVRASELPLVDLTRLWRCVSSAASLRRRTIRRVDGPWDASFVTWPSRQLPAGPRLICWSGSRCPRLRDGWTAEEPQ